MVSQGLCSSIILLTNGPKAQSSDKVQFGQSLTVPNLKSKRYWRYVRISKSIAYIGFCPTQGFRHPLGVLGTYPLRTRVGNWTSQDGHSWINSWAAM